ncbi:uncharacterized protein P174DRAFT_422944 [Aspergillus novofumigatus IBT 16806]|uniref:Transcription elongation factor S-II n=1 Tax=Aspergillus novofumigatus (strain IBT 16806) TaxID=1392255 RepID=A0A2I1C2C0_ASPN1|nr:uncharacterized protein P174DRAFT_422944 [Aspergillus novofumigatus IBT 16806]PKX91796.1 hypothetical protein P174DRAFT_422944 [Aspergillus novofumigatus IBT 16806]
MALDAKEIELKAKALTKAATQNEPAANIVSLLKELQTGVKATEDLLRSTRVGIIVNKFKQHKSPEVARLSSEIVSKWRNEVNKQKASGSPSVSQRSSGSPRPAQNGTASPAGTTPSDKMSKLSVPPDKRTWKADGVDINQTSNKIRDSCIGLMYDGLCLNSTESPRAVLSKACAVEAAAFSALGPETKEQYRTKIRSLYQNLKNKSNPTLRVRVLSNEVTPEQFVKMSHDELKSAEQREQERKIQKENMDKAMVAQAERSISTSLQCGKCGQRKVTYTEAQTRSADEPMTLFFLHPQLPNPTHPSPLRRLRLRSPATVLLSHFTADPLPMVHEHGLPVLAPFLGRTFTGKDGVGRYFELIADLLSFEKMSFDGEDEWIVDTVSMAVSLRGRARFTWKETGEGWDETFCYRIGLAEDQGKGGGGLKVQEYRVWADTGAAYLARTHQLGEVQRELAERETKKSMERTRSGHGNLMGEGQRVYSGGVRRHRRVTCFM